MTVVTGPFGWSQVKVRICLNGLTLELGHQLILSQSEEDPASVGHPALTSEAQVF